MPLPLIPAFDSRREPVASAVASCARVKARNVAERRALAGHHDTHSGIGRAGRHRRGSKDQREDGDPDRLVLPARAADRIAGDDVAELVRDDALELVHIVGGLEKPRLDIDGLALRDEGVDLGIVEQDDLDALRIEPGRDDQRLRHVA